MANPDLQTQLALERTYLAHERTLMAWVRTGLALSSFGFTIYKFFQFLRLSPAGEGHRTHTWEFALAMIGLGLVATVFGLVDYRRGLIQLRREKAQFSGALTVVFAMLVLGLGLLFLVAVAMRQ
ncbi:MAG TPA: DUF202 domain-containing protein, partial [bacterium]|nr:DUF202 domain-containing protein [bacterium]